MQELKLKDPERFGFKPKQLLAALAQIYLNLGSEQDFIRAVANDGRSYSKEVFERFARILKNRAIMTDGEVQEIVAFTQRVEDAKATIEIEDEREIPDEFLGEFEKSSPKLTIPDPLLATRKLSTVVAIKLTLSHEGPCDPARVARHSRPEHDPCGFALEGARPLQQRSVSLQLTGVLPADHAQAQVRGRHSQRRAQGADRRVDRAGQGRQAARGQDGPGRLGASAVYVSRMMEARLSYMNEEKIRRRSHADYSKHVYVPAERRCAASDLCFRSDTSFRARSKRTSSPIFWMRGTATGEAAWWHSHLHGIVARTRLALSCAWHFILER